jgi:hypothetical protein
MAMNPDGSPDGVPAPDWAIAIRTARNVPSPSTRQMTNSTNTWGLARKYLVSARMLPDSGTAGNDLGRLAGSAQTRPPRLSGHEDGRARMLG